MRCRHVQGVFAYDIFNHLHWQPIPRLPEEMIGGRVFASARGVLTNYTGLDKVSRYFTVQGHAASATVGVWGDVTASAGGHPNTASQSVGAESIPLRCSGLLPLWIPRVNTR